MSPHNTCRFRLEHSGCDIYGTVGNCTYRVMEEVCLNMCKGSQGDAFIVARLSKRMNVEYAIATEITEAKISSIIKQGGAVSLLHTGEFLVREEPLYQETIELEMPSMIEKACNLAKTAAAVSGKLFIDCKDDGLWAGLKGVRACKKQIELRKAACDKCPHRKAVKKRERCLSFVGNEKGCGCFLGAKRKLAASRCIGKMATGDKCRWDDIDRRFNKKKTLT